MRELGLTNIPMFGLAKRLEELYPVTSHDPLVLPRSSSSLRLLQQVRDEAHRFAITYHRKLREKRTFQTELTNIPGVGKKTAIKLLEKFGSAQGVREASEPELVTVVGLKAMKSVVNYFKDQQLAKAVEGKEEAEQLEADEEVITE
jgi:excinuclease ABC subunit C